MSYVPPITDTPIFHQHELAGLDFSTADLDTKLLILRDSLNLLIARQPLSTNADGTPLTTTVSTATAATVLAALAGTGGAALVGTLQAGGTVEAALATIIANVSALTTGLGTSADIIRRTGTVPFTADQSMGSHKLTNLLDGTSAQDAVTVTQLQAVAANVTASANALKRDGSNTMLANLPFNGFKGVGAANATLSTDLATKGQIDTMLAILSPVGSLLECAFSTPPTGYLLCNGAAVSRTTYAALFAAIGTAYGPGDGATTFNIPDAVGRAALGAGTGSSPTTLRILGEIGGEEAHALTAAENGPHTHLFYFSAGPGSGPGPDSESSRGAGDLSDPTNSSGSGTPHNNMQPYWVNQTFIRYQLATV